MAISLSSIDDAKANKTTSPTFCVRACWLLFACHTVMLIREMEAITTPIATRRRRLAPRFSDILSLDRTAMSVGLQIHHLSFWSWAINTVRLKALPKDGLSRTTSAIVVRFSGIRPTAKERRDQRSILCSARCIFRLDLLENKSDQTAPFIR